VLVIVASAVNEPEVALIRAQLADAGIDSVTKGPNIAQAGPAGASDVYVEERDEQRAREVLAAPPLSDEELAELSEQAGRALGNPPLGD
jgi:hypothetical protein